MRVYTYITYISQSGEEKINRYKGFIGNIHIGDTTEIHGETCKVVKKQVRFEWDEISDLSKVKWIYGGKLQWLNQKQSTL